MSIWVNTGKRARVNGNCCPVCGQPVYRRYAAYHVNCRPPVQRSSDGRWLVYRPAHKRASANGYVMQSDLVAEQQLKRALTSAEVVHHVNGPEDDKPTSLIVFPGRSEHMRWHHHVSASGDPAMFNQFSGSACWLSASERP